MTLISKPDKTTTTQKKKITGQYYWWIGEGNGNPLQYSCLENPTNGGASQSTVHGVARVGHDLATKPPPTFLMNTDAKILKKVLPNQNNSTLKVSYTVIKWCLSLKCKCFNIHISINKTHYINRMKDKNHRIISRAAEK